MAPLDILGHRTQIAELEDDIRSGNVAHAYLLSGPKHLGKFTIAKWFSRELLTIGAADEKEKKAIAGRADRLLHPDYLQIDQLWIEDVCEDADVIARSTNISQHHRKEAKAKMNEIRIDDIRVLQERLYEVGERKHRCCVIRAAERMGEAATNGLLKILEEPPPGVVFILTTESPSSLRPTLLSRVRQVRFFPLSRAELQPLFTDVEPDDAQFLAHLAQGAPGVIAQLRADPEKLRTERQIHGQATDFWNTASPLARMQLLKPLHERGDASDRFLLHLALALRERPVSAIEAQTRAFNQLASGLRTNAHRKLLSEQFALSVR